MAMPAATTPEPSGSPYAAGAQLYWDAGWRGVLPLPPGAKKPVPTGWTGREGQWPSWADVYTWADDGRASNLALRMPKHIIGIDVDAYNDKIGAQTLKESEDAWGELPPTWRSTSRDDGISGIQLFRIPEDLSWPGEVGPDIEIIRWCHRYTVAWPSLHPEGRTYRWIDPGGISRIGDVPHVDQLPDLPETWIVGLTKGEADDGLPKADLDDPAANAWLVAHGAGEPCKATQRALDRYLGDLHAVRGSRHDAGLYGQRRIAGLAAEGHTGALDAMGRLYAAFTAAATQAGKDQRSPDEAQAEWRRGLAGAIKLAAAQPEGDGDPCDAPFGDLITNAHQTGSPIVPEPIPAPHQPPAPEEGGVQRERTSWWPVDLESALSGDNPEPEPAYLTRDDDQPLIYPAKVNGIIGESESGKTWIALLAVKQALIDGINVTYLDFEDTAPGIISRLVAMSTDPDQLRAHLAYIGPDSGLDTLSSTDLAEHLDTFEPGLVVVDGVNAAMTLLGLDLISNTDATRFAQTLLRPISARGCAVLYVDHTPKDKANEAKGGIGAQAKRAMTTGAAFKIEAVKQFGKGQDGKLRMRVDKDRPGHVRGASLPGTNGHWAGDVNITAQSNGTLEVTVAAPGEVRNEAKPFRPTHLMERVSAFLATLPEGASKSTIEKEVNGKAEGLRAAVDRLVEEEYAERVDAGRGRVIVKHLKTYAEMADLTSSRPRPDKTAGQSDVVPTSSRSLESVAEAPNQADVVPTSSLEHRRSGDVVPPRPDVVPTSSQIGDSHPQDDPRSTPPEAPYVVGAVGGRGRQAVGGTIEEDQNSGTSSPEDRACRSCGTILDANHLLVGGKCSRCITPNAKGGAR